MTIVFKASEVYEAADKFCMESQDVWDENIEDGIITEGKNIYEYYDGGLKEFLESEIKEGVFKTLKNLGFKIV